MHPGVHVSPMPTLVFVPLISDGGFKSVPLKVARFVSSQRRRPNSLHRTTGWLEDYPVCFGGTNRSNSIFWGAISATLLLGSVSECQDFKRFSVSQRFVILRHGHIWVQTWWFYHSCLSECDIRFRSHLSGWRKTKQAYKFKILILAVFKTLATLHEITVCPRALCNHPITSYTWVGNITHADIHRLPS